MGRKAVVMIMIASMLILTGCGGQAVVQDPEADTSTEKESEQIVAESEPVIDEPAQDVEPEVETEVDPEPEPETVTLIMVGDILLHDPIEAAAKRDDGSYDFEEIFAHTSDLISKADVALVNQEVIIGGEELGISGYPAFNAPYEIGDALYDAGFDVVLHATNHALDKGATGIDNCLAYWKGSHPDMAVVGVYDSSEERDEEYIREVNGIKIAILNYTYGTNGIPLPDGRPYAVNLMDDAHRDQIAEDLADARENADFVIVCPHWGIEYELNESYSQREWASFFADNGADLIIGTHPHVIEPIEMIEDEVEGDETLCYYSLGNFVNWTSGTGAGVANRMVGGMAEVTIEKTPDGTVEISDYGVRALVAHLTDGQDGVTVYPLSDYTEDLGWDNRIRAQDGAFSYDYCVNLCNDIWLDKWE